MKVLLTALAASAALVAGPAFARDKPAPAKTSTSFSFETGTEYNALTKAYADLYAKSGISHTFANGLIFGGSFQQVWKTGNAQQEAVESTLGYNHKINSIFTLTSSAGVGYVWDSNPANQPAQNFAYYVVNAGLNAKLSPHWTWTVVQARWRDALIGNWQTPKLTTSIAYAWTPNSQLYASYGYGWKNNTADKYSVALGLKIAY